MSETVSISTVLHCVAESFGTPIRFLRSERRPQGLCRARHAACLLASELTGFASGTIGRQMGGRDHSTVLKSIDVARELCATDEDYAVKVDAARQAAIVLSRSSLASLLRDVDVVSAAERICGDPVREATRVSTNEAISMAARLLDLEDVAGTTFQLLTKLSDFLAKPLPFDRESTAYHRECSAPIEALAETLLSALAALGYTPENEEQK